MLPSAMKLDQFDLKILTLLQRDGRITKLKLAEQIGLSPSPCWERMERLEKAGYITGYHAQVDVTKLLRSSTVFVEVTLKNHEAEAFARFEEAVQDVEEILECYAIGGGVDYILKVIALDIDDYQRLIDELLAADLGIGKYFTYVVTKPVKRRRDLPLDYLLKRL